MHDGNPDLCTRSTSIVAGTSHIGSLEEADEQSLYPEDEGMQPRFTIVSTAVEGEGWKTVMDETMSQLTRAEFLLAVGKMIEHDKRRNMI